MRRACGPPAIARDIAPTPLAVQQDLPLADPVHLVTPLAPTSITKLWFCVWLPNLPLESVGGDSTGAPVAIVEEQHGIHRILLADAEARAAGVLPGQAANAALALLPTLQLEERSLLREQQVLEGLATWLERFSSFVSIADQDILLLEIAGSLRLFGGLQELRQKISKGLQGLGFTAGLAIAPTPLAATWMARAGRRACIQNEANLTPVLRKLPLACLDWPMGLCEALTGMGVMTVGDCLRLPREGFTRRFGAEYLLQLDRALGHLPDPRNSWRAPERFCADYEMTEEQTDRELLLNICRELLLSHEQFLLARQLGTQRVCFSFFHLKSPATELRLGCARAERSAGRWFELLGIRFEQLVLPEPVIAVRLRSGMAQPLQVEAGCLSFNGKPGVQERRFSITQLAERLIARIGDQSVQATSMVAEHRPDYAWRSQSLLADWSGTTLDASRASPLPRQAPSHNGRCGCYLSQRCCRQTVVIPCTRVAVCGSSTDLSALRPAGGMKMVFPGITTQQRGAMAGACGYSGTGAAHRPGICTAISDSSVSVRYAELHALSNFTFLRGASHPEELVETAAKLGYDALAITDECSMSGIVRAHSAAKEFGLKKLIIGAELRLRSGRKLVALAQNRNGYTSLCRVITNARRAAEKGRYELTRLALEDGLPDCLVLWVPDTHFTLDVEDHWIRETFRDRLWIAVELLADGRQRAQMTKLREEGRRLDLPLVAAGDVHMHCRARRVLQDAVTAIRHGTTIDNAGFALYPNGERHLRPLEVLQRTYPADLLEETLRIADSIDFSLDELRYEYPNEIVPDGETPVTYLRHLTEEGMQRRWPEGVPRKVTGLIEHELALIADLRYEPYFLTVYDIVAFARSQGILCQGRGSAANSAVCFCLGITEVDPGRMEMLVERFISKERNEPPDIDVDFEHERREEVIQYIYGKYGRERAALAATVITYRPRSALRDVGKVLGLSDLQVGRLSRSMQWWDGHKVDDSRILEAGLSPDSPIIRRLLYLVSELIGFPRHLSQHVGGFIISDAPLYELVPVENAAMPDRTVIQWEKNDLEDLGLLKVDVLGLGMLTAIRRSFDLIRQFDGREYTLATVPAEDPQVYDMICAGETMGVFQIESRAQMTMLPRLRPRCYYDLVIEVAIIRPGPIQGDMVHPYLRRRNGEEAVDYPSEEVKGVLQRTLGIPIFQEQVMQLAVVAAGFTPGEADRLRRAMAAWKRRGGLGPFEDKLVNGMRERGYEEEFARQIFQQILGFGEYGFPESHSASFALLVYVSSWLKCHEPAAFTCALLNSQPMGFYSASQLVQDTQRNGVTVQPVDINCSAWDCSLEADEAGAAVLRLGLRMVKGLSENAGQRIVAERPEGGYIEVQALLERAGLDQRELGVLASSGALRPLSGDRHRARWAVAGAEKPMPLFPSMVRYEAAPLLQKPTEGQNIVADYRSTGLTLERHPMCLLRRHLDRYRYVQATSLPTLGDGHRVNVAGLVITKQRPGTASGVIFVTLEDETGQINLVLWKQVAEQYRAALLNARLLGVAGELQIEGQVIHVIAQRLFDHSELLGNLSVQSRDFR